MPDKIHKTVGDQETAGQDDSLNITPENTSNLSLGTLNLAEANRENLLATTCEQAYFTCLDGGRDGLPWANRSTDSDATPTASCVAEAPGYLDHLEPHPLSLRKPDLSILHLETHLTQAVDEKGKGRMVFTELEAEAIIWESDQETPFEDPMEDNGGLTREEKDEQSRHDAELSLLLLAQELLEQGVPREEVASYVFQTQAFAMSFSPAPVLASPFHSPMSSSRHRLDEKPDLDRIAQLTVDEIAKRPLPPAYGPHYSPEPSTSQAGSPILAVRRLSISSTTSSTSTTSASSGAQSSSYTLEEEDELVTKMRQFLDERYEANKVTILSDLDKEVEKKHQPEHPSRSRWDMWRQRFGLGLVGGVGENWTTRYPQHHDHPSLTSPPLDIPNDVRFLQEGGHSCGHGHTSQGSAVRTPRGPRHEGDPINFHSLISLQGAGDSSLYNAQGLGPRGQVEAAASAPVSTPPNSQVQRHIHQHTQSAIDASRRIADLCGSEYWSIASPSHLLFTPVPSLVSPTSQSISSFHQVTFCLGHQSRE